MVRSYRSPSMRMPLKNTRVYAPKAACLVLSDSDRMDFAQFCLILLSAQRDSKRPKNAPTKDQEPSVTIYLKTKGSLTSGPYYFQDYIYNWITILGAFYTNNLIT